jgi:hypothetical protein
LWLNESHSQLQVHLCRPVWNLQDSTLLAWHYMHKTLSVKASRCHSMDPDFAGIFHYLVQLQYPYQSAVPHFPKPTSVDCWSHKSFFAIQHDSYFISTDWQAQSWSFQYNFPLTNAAVSPAYPTALQPVSVRPTRSLSTRIHSRYVILPPPHRHPLDTKILRISSTSGVPLILFNSMQVTDVDTVGSGSQIQYHMHPQYQGMIIAASLCSTPFSTHVNTVNSGFRMICPSGTWTGYGATYIVCIPASWLQKYICVQDKHKNKPSVPSHTVKQKVYIQLLLPIEMILQYY